MYVKYDVNNSNFICYCCSKKIHNYLLGGIHMKLRMKSISHRIMESVVSKSMNATEQSANSACVWWINQPKPPKNLKKLRKF